MGDYFIIFLDTLGSELQKNIISRFTFCLLCKLLEIWKNREKWVTTCQYFSEIAQHNKYIQF